MNRLLTRLGVLALAFTGLAALPATTAQAAVTTGPTAIAVGPDGTTYVGTAAGGSLARVDATGVLMSPLNLPRSGPVDGLFVEPASGNIWVSYGSGASKLSPSGAELSYLDTDPEGDSCDATDANDPGLHGGIVATPTLLVVAHRCGGGLNAYTLPSGSVSGASHFPCDAGQDCRYGDLAYSPYTTAQVPQGFFYATVPGTGQVDVWSGFYTHATPVRTIDVHTESGWAPPRPTGVAADDQGTLFVSDIANHVITVYDNQGNYQRYIGNPPEADTDDNGFDTPIAIAQYPRNGSIENMRGNLLIADSGNNRVVRRDTYTYRYWDAYLDGSGSGTPSTPPVNTTLPTVTGTPSVGQTLTCQQGEWAGAPTGYEFGWNRNGNYLPGQSSQTYSVVQADSGQKISCFVRARNGAGLSDYATSAKVTIANTPPPATIPANTIRPTIAGTPQPGQTLTCNNGSWNGSPAPTYSQQWLRNGSTISGATSSSYLVLDADLGSQLVCKVIATNSQGSASAQSAPVTVTSSTPPAPCTGTAGISINGAADYTNSTSVSLKIVPPAGATQVLISNDGGFDSASVRAITGCTYAWSLNNYGNRVSKFVYVRFAGGGVDELNTLQDDIVLDTNAPALPRPTVRAVSKGSKTYQVNLRASDRTTKVAKVQYAATKSGPRTTKAYKSVFRTTTPAKFTWVRVFDQAGNASAWKRSVR